MRKFNVFWIENLRKIGCVRKVPNANKPIKANGFLMISWFARFKNRFGKLQKSMKKRCRKSNAKNIGKSSKKSSKIDAKTIKKPLKKRCQKKHDFWMLRARSPEPPFSPTNTTKVNKTHSPSHTQTQQ